MKRLAILCTALSFAAPAAPVAQTDTPPPDPMILAMAQHFVQDRLMLAGGNEHYHIEFDAAFLYAQPREKMWVVVGGYMSDQNIPNSFTAAVSLDCPDHTKVTCWSLEKLSINGQIVLDRKRI